MTKFHLRLAVVGLSMCFFLLEGALREEERFHQPQSSHRLDEFRPDQQLQDLQQQ
jgi:hypothetical protein